MDEQKIAIVNIYNQIIGYQDKLEVHREGILHRAFSIFVFNEKREMLLQQRAFSKYHSPGLWTNTCCSHATENKEFETSIHERLMEEMGFDCKLDYQFLFKYKVDFENGLIEHEIDHVYFGFSSEDPNPNPEEVAAYCWVNAKDIRDEIKKHPEKFTYWFKLIFERVIERVADL